MSKSTSKDMNNNSTQNQMPEIYLDMTNKAIKSLNLVKAHFVVILPDGTTFDSGSDLITLVGPKDKKPKKTQQERKMPHGTYSTVFMPLLKTMQIGDVECFTPTPEMIANGVTIRDIQGVVSTLAHGLWGNDAHKSHQNVKANCIELLRMA